MSNEIFISMKSGQFGLHNHAGAYRHISKSITKMFVCMM